MGGGPRAGDQGQGTSMAWKTTLVQSVKRNKSCILCGRYFEDKSLDEIRSHIEECLEGWNFEDIEDAKAQSKAEALALSNPSVSASTSSLAGEQTSQDSATAEAQGKAKYSNPSSRSPAPSSSILDEEPEEHLADAAEGIPGRSNSLKPSRTSKPWASEQSPDDRKTKADRFTAKMILLGYSPSETSHIVARHMAEMEKVEKADHERRAKFMARKDQARLSSFSPRPSSVFGSPSSQTVGGRVSKGSPPERKAAAYHPNPGQANTLVGFSQAERSTSSSATTSQTNGVGLTPPALETDATISDDELTESDLPPPFTSSTPIPDEAAPTGEEVAASQFKTLPNPDDFLLALTQPTSRSTSALHTIAANTQAALKLWQDEYLHLDARLTRTDPDYKPKSNPRDLEDAATYEAKKAAFFAGRKYKDNAYCADPTLRARNKKLSEARKQRERELEEAALALSNSSDGAGGRRRRLRKPRILFDTGLNETDTAASRATSVLSTRKRKRADGLDDVEEEPTGNNTPSASTPPARKRGRPAAALPKKPLLPSLLGRRSSLRGPPASDNSSPAPKRKGRPPKKPSAGGPPSGRKPVVKDADGKNPTRREAMTKVWATRRANGTSGRHGGAPLAKGKKGRIGRPRKGEGRKKVGGGAGMAEEGMGGEEEEMGMGTGGGEVEMEPAVWGGEGEGDADDVGGEEGEEEGEEEEEDEEEDTTGYL